MIAIAFVTVHLSRGPMNWTVTRYRFDPADELTDEQIHDRVERFVIRDFGHTFNRYTVDGIARRAE